MGHLWSGLTYVMVPFAQGTRATLKGWAGLKSGPNSAGQAEVPLTGLCLPKGTSFSQLHKGTVWACVASTAPAPSLRAKQCQGSDLGGPEVETKTIPSEFFVYLFLAGPSFAFLSKDSMDFSEKKGLWLMYIDWCKECLGIIVLWISFCLNTHQL